MMSRLMNTLTTVGEEIINADGPYLIAKGQRRLLDWWNNSGANPLGSNPKELLQAIEDSRFGPNFVAQIHPFALREKLAASWCGVTEMDRVFFSNSGTETTETAIKLLRLVASQRERDGVIYALANSFHGRTFGAIAASDSPSYHRDGMGPHLPGFRFFEVPADIVWEETIGVLMTPIRCYKESRLHSDLFFTELASGLRANPEVGLAIDDVQTGAGRCGELSMIHYLELQHDVRADIVGLGKGVALGLPLTITLARGDYASAFSPGQHFCTFGGASILPMRVALNYLGWLRENMGLVKANEQILETKLRALPWIEDLNGMGMVWSFKAKHISSASLVKACRKQGLIVTAFGEPVKIFPQLNSTSKQIQEGVTKLNRAYEVALVKEMSERDDCRD
jgi:acetylornithine/succinyldiaminopimelate/putrescine aminotransferase